MLEWFGSTPGYQSAHCVLASSGLIFIQISKGIILMEDTQYWSKLTWKHTEMTYFLCFFLPSVSNLWFYDFEECVSGPYLRHPNWLSSFCNTVHTFSGNFHNIWHNLSRKRTFDQSAFHVARCKWLRFGQASEVCWSSNVSSEHTTTSSWYNQSDAY